MSNYKVVNPSAGNIIFDTANSATTATAENIGSGAAIGLGADAVNFSNIAHGIRQAISAGSIVPSGLSRTEPAATAGDFANMNDGEYIMMRVTTGLAGVANTTLRAGAAEFNVRNSIHKVMNAFRNTQTATAVRDGNWNVFSGVYSPAADTDNASIGNVTGSTVTDGTADHSANVTRADQGSFTFMDGSPNPTSGDYSAKLG